MAEFNSDDLDSTKQAMVILQTIQPDHALVKTNRYLLMLVCALLALVFILGLFIMPKQNTIDEISRKTSTQEATQNPVLSAEINTLKGQMFGLVSGSIESKLKSLEDNIRRGSIADSLDTIAELKGEVKILSTYSGQPSATAQQAVVDQTVIKELSELKGIIYLTFVSCGLMIAAMAGVWLRQRNRLTHEKRHKAFLGRKE